jgi:Ca2+-transporting ATPase
MLLVAVGAGLLLQLAAIYLPLLRELLGTKPMGPVDLLAVIAASSLGYVAIRLDRIIFPTKVPTALTAARQAVASATRPPVGP